MCHGAGWLFRISVGIVYDNNKTVVCRDVSGESVGGLGGGAVLFLE